MLDNNTKERIANDFTNKFKGNLGFEHGLLNVGKLELLIRQAYIAGAEAEAIRAQPLIEAYRELHSISNDQLNEMEKLIKDYEPDREKVSRAYELLKKIEALANYNNPK